jgi:hypothetical protein
MVLARWFSLEFRGQPISVPGVSGVTTPSDELMELAFFALDHGVESVREGGPLIPFAVTETAAGRDLSRFMAETLEQGQEEARRHVRSQPDADRVAVAYDGYATIEGERSDAIFVEAHERGQPASVIILQRYRPRGRLKKFDTIGNPALAGEAAPLR